MGKKGKRQTTGPKIEYPYPSRYGSHASMLVDTRTIPRSRMNLGWVVCEDERGYYVTEEKRLDSRVHDPHRTSSSEVRKEKMNELFPYYGGNLDEDRSES